MSSLAAFASQYHGAGLYRYMKIHQNLRDGRKHIHWVELFPKENPLGCTQVMLIGDLGKVSYKCLDFCMCSLLWVRFANFGRSGVSRGMPWCMPGLPGLHRRNRPSYSILSPIFVGGGIQCGCMEEAMFHYPCEAPVVEHAKTRPFPVRPQGGARVLNWTSSHSPQVRLISSTRSCVLAWYGCAGLCRDLCLPFPQTTHPGSGTFVCWGIVDIFFYQPFFFCSFFSLISLSRVADLS